MPHPTHIGRRVAGLLSLAVIGIASAAQTAAPAPTATALEHAYQLDAGDGGPRDRAAAAAIYAQAATAGDGYAHLRLGYLHETGDGVDQSYPLARQHYEAASNLGIVEAHVRLGMCYLEGWGCEPDRAAFAREIEIAAAAGYLPAQRILATLYFVGIGVPVDRALGLRWLEKAAAQDDASAQYDLARKLEPGRRLAQAADLKLARTWYQLSAEQDYAESMRAIARGFLSGDRTQRNWTLGQQWLSLADKTGDDEAPYILAVVALTLPDAPPSDIAKAQGWLERAADRGNARAREVLEWANANQAPLKAAVRYVLRTPFEDRYVQRLQSRADRNSPNQMPVPQRLVRPIYPASMRLSETAGEAVIRFVVDVTGRTQDLSVVSATHPLFGDRALEAVAQWRFLPGQKDGRIVNTRMQVPVKFAMDKETLLGADGLISVARDYAEQAGPDVLADAANLSIARPLRRLPQPTMDDGSDLPPESRVMLLLVLDENGAPLRGHVLNAKPENVGPRVLEAALNERYVRRIVDHQPTQSSVVFIYRASVPAKGPTTMVPPLTLSPSN